ncbi:hypothetical protein SAMN04488109_1508 [Chryseolinea serpens]|uniref:Uncharacterized protein n=1 Tax=Chryseolinea serpens TaxID=947013 RepID=A0A1M5M2T8_9BACT|nr:hypothetical protein [Chryseolinea serpens]SHG71033.1 hypothetical protein SAMN04488109_1508 [Chryseolinea serpens]
MKAWRLTILFLLLTGILQGQQNDFDLGNIKFRGVDFVATKDKIIKSFGQPKRVDTNYGCGFFSNDQPGGPFYQLVYTSFNYIGSDSGKFFLENVTFDLKGQTKIKYGESELSGQTSEADFIKIFGSKAKELLEESPNKDTVLLYSKDSDDGAIFTFKNGKLFKFEYWTPC